MADGRGERWGDFGGIPKHLLQIGGETLLQRTVRLLRENGVRDIIISARDPRYEVKGAERWAPPNNVLETDKFFSTRSRWNRAGETLLVYGDCFYTENAMSLMCAGSAADEPGGFLFFGREGPSAFTGKRWGELFGIRFLDTDKFLAACAFIRDGFAAGTIARGGGWELYRYLTDRPPNSEHLVTSNFWEINDFSDDFDFPEDYLSFAERLPKEFVTRRDWITRARRMTPYRTKLVFRRAIRLFGQVHDWTKVTLLTAADRRRQLYNQLRGVGLAGVAFGLWRRLPLSTHQRMRIKSAVLRAAPKLAYNSPAFRERSVPPNVLEQISSQWLLEPALVAVGANAVGHARVVPSNYLSLSTGFDLSRLMGSVREQQDWLIIVPHLVVGGADKYVAELVQHLTAVGKSTQIWVTDQSRLEASAFFENSISFGVDASSVLFMREVLGGAAKNELIFARLVNSARPRNVAIFNSDVALRSVVLSGRALSRRTNVFCWFFSVGVKGLGAPYANRYARRLAPWCHLATDNSPAKDAIEAWTGSSAPVAVIPPSVTIADEHLFRQRIETCLRRGSGERKRWLWLSRVERLKGTDVLSKIVQLMPEVDFDIYGPLQQPLSEFLPGRNNAHYRGVMKHVATADLTAYDGFIFTSLFEGMPNIVLEISQHGLPMVLAKVGGLADTFTPSSVWFVEQDDDPAVAAARFADAIRTVNDTAQEVKLAAVSEARARVAERHSPAAFGAAMVKFTGDAS